MKPRNWVWNLCLLSIMTVVLTDAGDYDEMPEPIDNFMAAEDNSNFTEHSESSTIIEKSTLENRSVDEAGENIPLISISKIETNETIHNSEEKMSPISVSNISNTSQPNSTNENAMEFQISDEPPTGMQTTNQNAIFVPTFPTEISEENTKIDHENVSIVDVGKEDLQTFNSTDASTEIQSTTETLITITPTLITTSEFSGNNEKESEALDTVLNVTNSTHEETTSLNSIIDMDIIRTSTTSTSLSNFNIENINNYLNSSNRMWDEYYGNKTDENSSQDAFSSFITSDQSTSENSVTGPNIAFNDSSIERQYNESDIAKDSLTISTTFNSSIVGAIYQSTMTTPASILFYRNSTDQPDLEFEVDSKSTTGSNNRTNNNASVIIPTTEMNVIESKPSSVKNITTEVFFTVESTTERADVETFNPENTTEMDLGSEARNTSVHYNKMPIHHIDQLSSLNNETIINMTKGNFTMNMDMTDKMTPSDISAGPSPTVIYENQDNITIFSTEKIVLHKQETNNSDGDVISTIDSNATYGVRPSRKGSQAATSETKVVVGCVLGATFLTMIIVAAIFAMRYRNKSRSVNIAQMNDAISRSPTFQTYV